MSYTFNALPNGNIEVNQDGQHISTGTAEFAQQNYGYNPSPAGTANTATPIKAPTEMTGSPAPVTPANPAGAPVAPTVTTPAPATTPPAPAATPAAPVSGYTGPSVVDYLNSTGRPADYNSRAALAHSLGIQNYTGTAAQNTQMLNSLRASAPPAPASPAPATPAPGGDTGTTPTTGDTSTDPYAGMDPITRQVQETKDAATQLGLPQVKQQMEAYTKQLDDVNNELQDKILTVNNNPWLSQGNRDKQIANLKDSYATRTDALTHLITLTNSLYTTGQAQVEKLVTGAEADRKMIADTAQKQLDAAAALAKDNTIQSIDGHEWLVNKATGKKIVDLGPSTKTAAGQGTAAERAASAVASLQTRIQSGQPLADGTRVIDPNGFITPVAWKRLIQQAPSEGLNRSEFLKEFGTYLFTDASGNIPSSYGLTPLEIKTITGALPT